LSNSAGRPAPSSPRPHTSSSLRPVFTRLPVTPTLRPPPPPPPNSPRSQHQQFLHTGLYLLRSLLYHTVVLYPTPSPLRTSSHTPFHHELSTLPVKARHPSRQPPSFTTPPLSTTRSSTIYGCHANSWHLGCHAPKSFTPSSGCWPLRREPDIMGLFWSGSRELLRSFLRCWEESGSRAG